MNFLKLIVGKYIQPKNKFLFIFTICSSGFTIGIFIFLIAITRGGYSSILDSVLNLYGHGSIRNNLARAKKLDDYVQIVETIYTHCFIIKNNTSNTIFTIGVDDLFFRNKLQKYVRHGFVDLIKDSIVIGEELANKLDLCVGDKIFLNLSSKLIQCEVSAIIQTGMGFIDQEICFISKNTIIDNDAFYKTKNLIFLKNPDEIDQYKTKCEDNGIMVTSWKDTFAFLDKIFSQIKLILFLILGILMINSVSQVFMSMTILVLQKKRETIVLTKLGITNNQKRNIFILYGLFLILLKILSGVIIGVGFVYFVYPLCIELVERFDICPKDIVDVIVILQPKIIPSDLLSIISVSFVFMSISTIIGVGKIISHEESVN